MSPLLPPSGVEQVSGTDLSADGIPAPSRFWQSAAEAKGESPFKVRLPLWVTNCCCTSALCGPPWNSVFHLLIVMLHAERFTWGAQDPLAIIGIVSILFPFLILGIAIASGYLDLSPYQYPHH